MDDAATQRKIVNRLKRARGQLGAVITALESGAECSSTVVQLSAVSGALNRAQFAIVSSAMRECLTPATAGSPGPNTTLDLDQLEKLFIKFT